jgi:transposase
MTRQNPILKRARISTAKFRQILKYFALDIEATKIAQLTGLNRNTINKYLLLVRKVIALEWEREDAARFKDPNLCTVAESQTSGETQERPRNIDDHFRINAFNSRNGLFPYVHPAFGVMLVVNF